MPIGMNKLLQGGGDGAGFARKITVLDEGNDCRPTIGLWNRSEYSSMYGRPDINSTGYWHGWGGSARSYDLNMNDLPPHRYLNYSCYIHHVDSWDNEYQYVNVDGQRIANWRKQWNENRFREMVCDHNKSATSPVLLARFGID